jgi:hypothetical protein
VGLGQAGLVALCASATQEKRIAAVATVEMPTSLLAPEAYPAGTRMGLLAPGLLKAGDVPHLAALGAPRRLSIVGGLDPLGKKLDETALAKSFAFTREVYRRVEAADALKVAAEVKPADLASWLQ